MGNADLPSSPLSSSSWSELTAVSHSFQVYLSNHHQQHMSEMLENGNNFWNKAVSATRAISL